MKSTKQFSVIIFLLLIVPNFLFKKIKLNKDDINKNNEKSTVTHNQISKKFELLFDQPKKKESFDYHNKDKKKAPIDKLNTEIKKGNGKSIIIPLPKRNPFEDIKQGEGESAYFFDFLDPILQFEISYEFKRIFYLTKNIPYDPVDDPYSYSKLSRVFDTVDNFNLFQKISNREKWDNCITIPQIRKVAEKWNWWTNSQVSDYGKYFVDIYDFDGDGRLNISEFVVGMIVENVDTIGGKYGCESCMEYVIENKIDIIFKYLSNDSSGYIMSQQIWEGLKHLKRGSNSNFYSLYNCQYPKNMRTNAVNDFLLKANYTMKGKIDLKEFRLGILLGYWKRQVDYHKIYFQDEKNKKNERWTPEGVDIQCDKYKKQV